MKHKVIFLLTIAMVAGVSLKAQLNVGSTAPADVSAILQATSTTKGFLPPVMTTAQINAILLPANGLTVYNSTLSQLQVNVGTTFVPSWSVVAGGANVYWSQQGNTGTVPGTNYVGTTDNVALSLGTNGVERVRIDSATGNVGIGNSGPTTKLDVGGAILVRGGGFLPNGGGSGISWNSIFGGFGRSEFINYSGLGPGGFSFLRIGGSGVASQSSIIAHIDGGGAITSIGNSAGYYANDRTRPSRQGVLYTQDGNLRLYHSQYGDGILLDSTGVVTIPKALSMNNNNNIFIGAQSGLLTSGTGNTFLGIRSGLNNTSGYNNTFSGYESGLSNTSGAVNVFYGFQSGHSNIATGANTFIGYQSGYSNANVNNNQFIGYQSGYTNTSGYENTFNGAQSGYNNTTGIYNTFTGYLSGFANTTGSSNVFTGWHSGLNHTSGGGNIFYGVLAGVNTTTSSSNVFIGYNAGANNTTGNANTSIGDQAGPNSSALTNTTSIGAGTHATQSNTVILGSGANVGINMTTPSQTLQVNGNIKAGLDNNGSLLLNPGNGSQAGYLRFYRGDGVTSPGFIGYDNTDLYYRAENGAQHRFSGNNVIVENMLNVGGAATVGSGGLPAQGGGTGFTWNTYEGGFGESEFVNFSGLGPGGFRFYRVYGGNTTNSGNWTAFINSGGAYSQVSDERTKTNIKTVANGLSTIMALHPISYNLHLDRTIKNGMVTFGKNDEVSKQFGFSAQEMYKVIPEAVDKPKDVANDFYSVNYTAVIPILTKAIQEQQAQIATQTVLIKQQQTQNDKQVSISKALQLEIALLKKDNLDIVTQLSEMNELKLAVAQLRSELNITTVTRVAVPIPVTAN